MDIIVGTPYLFDVEVMKHNSMVVFKDLEGKTVRVFSSSLDGLGDLYEQGIITGIGYDGLEEFIEGNTLIGYNNHYYDDYILYAMMKKELNPFIKEWNDSIIKKRSTVNMKRVDNCKTLDCFQQIDISKPSLKRIEGNMGSSIRESNVDFDIDRKLTPFENFETFLYCEYDVLQTLAIWNMRQNYFKSKAGIIDMIDDEHIKDKAWKWNTTSIIGHLLKPKRKAPSRRLVDDELFHYVPQEVQDMWYELDNSTDYKFKKKKVIVEEDGVRYEFGWGGLHGVPKGFVQKDNIRLMDVASMYPNILILLEGLGTGTDQYKSILDYRLELKHQGKHEEQAPLKLILNSTYGLLNNQYSALNHPKLAYSICIYGQIALYTLSKRLANIGAEIINVNTDGVAYHYTGNEDEQVKKQWEKEFKLTLETDYFKKWWQVDVNNYIALTDNGKIETKGGYTNKYHENKYFANNNARIVHIALVEYIVNGVDVATTINKHKDDPLLFQYILNAGGTYKGVVDTNEPDTLIPTKINRIFASKEGIEIVKKRADGGTAKFPDAPTKMYLWNDDVKRIKNFGDIVDLQFYYDLTMKNLEAWK